MYAISILNIYKDINLAVKYSEIAEQIYLTMPDKYSASMAHIWRGHLIDHWHCHVKLSTEHIEKGMQEARESGNILAYLLALFIHAFAQCAEAKSLSKATEILLISYTKADARGMEGMSTHFELLYHIYSILGNEDNGVTERFSYLENKICHSKSLLEYGTGQKFISFYYYFQEDYEKSIEFHFRWYVVEEKIRYELFVIEVKTINVLALMRQLPTVDSSLQNKYKKRIKQLMRDVEWGAKVCPANYLHHHLFLKAYELQANKKYAEALTLFNEAIKNAKKGDFYL
jgi:hypothetical protein